MGVLVMVLGASGSGKSTSLMKLADKQVDVFCATSKRLPFRTPLETHTNAGYREIYEALKANKYKAYVIDDSTYLMQLDNFRHAKEKGYDKFTTMALSFQTLLQAAMDTDSDTVVYFLHHPQFGETGNLSKPQTIGKMLDNQLCVEGLFDIILECGLENNQHVFWTNEHGISKTPICMFEQHTIPNDLDAVDTTIREYWQMAALPKTKAKGGKDE